jgi:hypothetical protein
MCEHPTANVHLTDSVVDVAVLEHEACAHVIRVSSMRTTWREELASALEQATGERSCDAAIAHICTMRSPNHWSSVFLGGIAPRADVFLSYVAEVCLIGVVFVSLTKFLGVTGDRVAWWLAKRQSVADWVQWSARRLEPRLENGVAHVLRADMDSAVASGLVAAFQCLFLSATLFAIGSRLRETPSPCEAAAWSACTKRPACIVLVIEYLPVTAGLTDSEQLRLCMQFLHEHIGLTAIVRFRSSGFFD